MDCHVNPYNRCVSIHHLQLWVPDATRSENSWGWLLGELGYELARRWDHGCMWRKDGSGIVLETSPDMVPGMLHSRLRPGLNHVAFRVDSPSHIARLVDEAGSHGWTQLGGHRHHPLPSKLMVAYLEDTDGFEVELVSPDQA